MFKVFDFSTKVSRMLSVKALEWHATDVFPGSWSQYNSTQALDITW